MKPKKGLYNPTNKDKYIGDVNNIIYRSNIELYFFNFFDKNENIIKWGSEELFINYVYSIDKKIHKYYPDIIIYYKNKKNEIKKAIIEIKCYNEIKETVYLILQKKSFNKEKSISLITESLKIKKNEIGNIIKNYKPSTKKSKKYIEHMQYIIKNIDKWMYAINFCKHNNLEFYVLCENDLKNRVERT